MAPSDRTIPLGEGLSAIPERLLLAHARGQVLFICGAGISRPAGLPDFRQLVLQVYEKLDLAAYSVLNNLQKPACNQWQSDPNGLTAEQTAEVKRFIVGDYDVVLGMLERRLDNQTLGDSKVRSTVAEILRTGSSKPAPIHKALMSLADRGGTRTIVTTNFDLMLQAAAPRKLPKPLTYSLGSIPRPSRREDFSGVLHIHGALDKSPKRVSELVVTDQDFGEYYLRRRIVPDFIYDAARLYHLVLVGYSANDPPMRYLLNAVAADGNRFDDLKERFTFFGASSQDDVALADWRGRGITPIHYNSDDGHSALKATLERWAALSAINGTRGLVERELKRIAKTPKSDADETDRDLFEHFFRRSNARERLHLIKVISKAKADTGWLDTISQVFEEPAH